MSDVDASLLTLDQPPGCSLEELHEMLLGEMAEHPLAPHLYSTVQYSTGQHPLAHTTLYTAGEKEKFWRPAQ